MNALAAGAGFDVVLVGTEGDFWVVLEAVFVVDFSVAVLPPRGEVRAEAVTVAGLLCGVTAA